MTKKLYFNYKTLRDYCVAQCPTDVAPDMTYNADKDYWFKDNGGSILAVAHFDTVALGVDISVKKLYKNNKCVGINTIQLDDRLGFYIINELLPQMGVVCDILVTNDEEIGRSSGGSFTTKKDYNFMFSFDRQAIAPVLYQYDSDSAWDLAVNAVSKTSWGTYSDISSMQHLGICGVNWGTGYNSQHSDRCYAYWDDIRKCVENFTRFYQINKDKKYSYTGIGGRNYLKSRTTKINSAYGYSYADCWGGDYYDSYSAYTKPIKKNGTNISKSNDYSYYYNAKTDSWDKIQSDYDYDAYYDDQIEGWEDYYNDRFINQTKDFSYDDEDDEDEIIDNPDAEQLALHFAKCAKRKMESSIM